MSSTHRDITGVHGEAAAADICKSDIARAYLCAIENRAKVHDLRVYHQLWIAGEITHHEPEIWAQGIKIAACSRLRIILLPVCV